MSALSDRREGGASPRPPFPHMASADDCDSAGSPSHSCAEQVAVACERFVSSDEKY